MADVLAWLVGFIWNYPVVILCLFCGLFFTLRLAFIQLRCLPHALSLVLGHYDNPNEKGQITHFQALTAALSGTIGLGNIAGVSIAIAMGGPGSVLWMWIVGMLGMATKYVECTLGTHYREVNADTGVVRGGPMYYIEKGLGRSWRPMAVLYAVFMMLGALGAANMFQSNQAASALYEFFSIPPIVTGTMLLFLVGGVLLGGIKRIAWVASKIVPFMCGAYLLAAFVISLMNLSLLPNVLSIIVTDAFTGMAAAGGVVGFVIKQGVKRAVFSNEAGIGSASVAHAAVKTDYPIREGIVASLGPMIDTVIVCSATAFVIILSGHYGTQMYQGIETSEQSFESPALASSLPTGWTVTNHGVPDDTDQLRSFRSGDYVLTYSGDQSSSYTTLPLSLKEGTRFYDGLRFSYFRKTGDLLIRVKTESSEVLGEAVLGVDQSSNPLLELKGGGVTEQWASAVLLFSKDLKQQLSEMGQEAVFLEMIPMGGEVTLYVDRLHMIRALSGVALTQASFDRFLPGFGSIFITLAVFLFAFSTIITWSYYGVTASQFVFGEMGVKVYRLIYIVMVFFGALQTLDVVVNFSDAMLGLMVIPNSIAILILSPRVAKWTIDYFSLLKQGKIARTKGAGI